MDSVLDELVALERAALDKWIRLDPQGYLDTYASDVTYFDPMTDHRVDGLAAMTARFAPMRTMKAPIADPRYEMIEPKVQRHADVALLTFNLVNHGRLAGQPESVLARWNATEVYCRVNGVWKIVHSHWSFTTPDVKQTTP